MLRASGSLVLGSSAFVAAFSASLSASGCATLGRGVTGPRRLRTLHRGAFGAIVLSSPIGGDGDDEQFVDDGLPEALARLDRFGFALRRGVEIRLHGDVRAFQAATGRSAEWLRAWAGFDTIDVLPPRTWGDAAWPAPAERLAHELTHCATFQAFGAEDLAARARIPFFFSEGSASVVAGQEKRRLPLADVARRAFGACGLDEAWSARDHLVAYGAAHHTMAFVAQRWGDDTLAKIVATAAKVGGAGSIEDAFFKATRSTPCALWTLLAARALANPA